MTTTSAIVRGNVRNVTPLGHHDLLFVEHTMANKITAKSVWYPALIHPSNHYIWKDITHAVCGEVKPSKKSHRQGKFEVHLWGHTTGSRYVEAVFEDEARAVQFMLHAAKEFYR